MYGKSNIKMKLVLVAFLTLFVFLIANILASGIEDIPTPDSSIDREKKTGEKSTEVHPEGETVTYYVSVSGSDSNDGRSLENPFQTLKKAVGTAGPGDCVFVRDGIYHEAVVMKTSGDKNAPITFQNYQNESPVIDGTGLAAKNGILISQKDYIRWDGFTIQNFTSTDETTVTGILVKGSSQGIEIRNCKIQGIHTTYNSNDMDRNAHGIAAYGTEKDKNASLKGLILDHNEICNCKLGQSEAIALNGNVSDFTVTNNKIHDVDNIAIDFIGFEGTANSGKAGDPKAVRDRARNGICAENEVWNISNAKNPTYKGQGLCADGIYVDGGYNIVIEKNKIDKCDIGIEVASEHFGCSAKKIMIRNNLVANCKSTAGVSLGGASSLLNGSAVSVVIINNTLYNNRPNIQIQNADSSTNVIANNICYRGTYLEGEIGKNRMSDNLTENPRFVNTTTWDFHLKPDSPAIDAGIAADYGDTDMAGNQRVKGKAVDYGAFEF